MSDYAFSIGLLAHAFTGQIANRMQIYPVKDLVSTEALKVLQKFREDTLRHQGVKEIETADDIAEAALTSGMCGLV